MVKTNLRHYVFWSEIWLRAAGGFVSPRGRNLRSGTSFNFNGVGQGFEGAGGAFGFWFAEFFADADEEGVVFVKEGHVGLEVGFEEVL